MSISFISVVISTGLKLWILGLGRVRNLLADLRWFFIFIIYSLVESAVRLAFFHGGQGYFNDRAYFRVYWTSEAIEVVLLAMAVRESFSRTLIAFGRLNWMRIIFWICVSLPMVYSLCRAIIEPPARAGRLVAIIVAVEITVQYVVIAITLLYFGLVRFFNIRGYAYESGIILGFGANAGISACGYLMRSIFGARFAALSGWIPGIAFVVAEGVWAGTLARKPKAAEKAPAISLTSEEIVRYLDRYLQVLKDLVSKG